MKKKSVQLLIMGVWFVLIVISACKEEKIIAEKLSESGLFEKLNFNFSSAKN